MYFLYFPKCLGILFTLCARTHTYTHYISRDFLLWSLTYLQKWHLVKLTGNGRVESLYGMWHMEHLGLLSADDGSEVSIKLERNKKYNYVIWSFVWLGWHQSTLHRGENHWKYSVRMCIAKHAQRYVCMAQKGKRDNFPQSNQVN